MHQKVKMTRRVAFSSGHRYWIASMSVSENRKLFGEFASPYNHGHNYILDVEVSGSIDAKTGMVVNIKRIDDVLKQKIVAQFDGKSINDEVSHFLSKPSSLEGLMTYIVDELTQPGVLPPEVALTKIRLEEMPTLYGELTMDNAGRSISLTRTYEFAASHRLHSPFLSEQENIDLFGKCNNPAGHGHNYLLEVTLTGEPDIQTGMIANLDEIDRHVESLIVDRYDHRNLNEDLPEFQGRTTTSEVVAMEIFERLNGQLPASLTRIRLHETARNMFEVSAQ